MTMKPALVATSISVLFGLGLATTAMTQESELAGKHVFAKAASTEQFSRGPMLSKFMLTAEQTEGRYSMITEVFGAGFSSYPGHTHKFHSEVFFVISGDMEWTVDGDTQQIGPGDLVYIPPNSHHAGKVVGDEDVHALMIYEPAGYERNYFRRMELTPEERQDPEVMREVMEQADVHMNR